MAEQHLAEEIAKVSWKNHNTNVFLEGLTGLWSKLPEEKIHDLIQSAHDAIRENEVRAKNMLNVNATRPMQYNSNVINLLNRIEEIALGEPPGAPPHVAKTSDNNHQSANGDAEKQISNALKEFIAASRPASSDYGAKDSPALYGTKKGIEPESNMEPQPSPQRASKPEPESPVSFKPIKPTIAEPALLDDLRSIPSLSSDESDDFMGYQDEHAKSPLKTSHETKRLKERLQLAEERNAKLERELYELRKEKVAKKSRYEQIEPTESTHTKSTHTESAPTYQDIHGSSEQYLDTGRGLIRPRDLVRVWTYHSDKLKGDRQALRSEVAFLKLQALGYHEYIKLVEEVLDIVQILPKKPKSRQKPRTSMRAVALMVLAIMRIRSSAESSRRKKDFYHSLFKKV